MRATASLVAAVLAAQSATAQDIPCKCDAACAGTASFMEGLSFDDQEHRDWYETRFWTGQCVDGLPFCFSGEGWFDVMSELISKPAVTQADALCERLFALGRRMGHEWAKDNAIRTIHSSDFRTWSRRLRRAEDPSTLLDEIDAQVDERLSGS